MKKLMLPLLLALDLGLAGVLGWQWLTPDGEWKGIAWSPPAGIAPAVVEPLPLPELAVDLGRFVATLDRPLFVPARKPPPPPAPETVVAVDPAPQLRLLGLYSVAGSVPGDQASSVGGIIALVDGKPRRVRVGETVSGSWVLKAAGRGQAVLARGEEEKSYVVSRAGADEILSAAGSSDNAAPEGQESGRSAAVSAQRKRDLEEMRERVRRMNVLRARSGLPPLPEP